MKKKLIPLWQIILYDILLAGLFLCIYASFHHVIPSIQAKRQEEKYVAAATPAPTPVPASVPEEKSDAGEAEDDRTEWQKKFADHFTDEVIITENSYSSPNVSITVSAEEMEGNKGYVKYYIADIYIASIDCLRTNVASENAGYNTSRTVEEMAQEENAILAINGDYITKHPSGLIYRNGRMIFNTSSEFDLGVLFYNGELKGYHHRGYDKDEIINLNGGIWQSWAFGPVLYSREEMPGDTYSMGNHVGWRNPRSAFGCYEPGHYCFVHVAGRDIDGSVGLELTEFQKFFEDLGVACAYNMDGGGTSVMLFNGEKVSAMCHGDKPVGDILLISDRQPA